MILCAAFKKYAADQVIDFNVFFVWGITGSFLVAACFGEDGDQWTHLFCLCP